MSIGEFGTKWKRKSFAEYPFYASSPAQDSGSRAGNLRVVEGVKEPFGKVRLLLVAHLRGTDTFNALLKINHNFFGPLHHLSFSWDDINNALRGQLVNHVTLEDTDIRRGASVGKLLWQPEFRLKPLEVVNSNMHRSNTFELIKVSGEVNKEAQRSPVRSLRHTEELMVIENCCDV